jgi:mRNA-degrading endonuclease RelE of RelBE toxin-antitoxin system
MIGGSISMNFKFKVTPRFERSLRKLKRRYPLIAADLKPTFAEIETNPEVGVVIPDDFAIRKVRVASRDMQRGKSGGFRLLYKLSLEGDYLQAVLLFIYAKTDQENVSMAFLEALLNDLTEE